VFLVRTWHHLESTFFMHILQGQNLSVCGRDWTGKVQNIEDWAVPADKPAEAILL